MKVLKSQDSKLIELFEREALVLQLLEHEGIPTVTIDDYFTFTSEESSLQLHCLVMQKFEGQNLEEWVKTYGKVSQEQALDLLQQLFNIVDFVHRSGFFHRDIKPSNIILQTNDRLALIDFGAVREVTNTYLAKVSSSGGTDIGIGGQYEITVIRTACYSPLEQINGQAVPQSDFYAIGKTFVYLVTGIPLVKLPTDPQTGKLIWRKHASQIDEPFADFLDELMAPFPGQRPATTKIILERLQKLPLRSKIHRLTKSKTFRVSAVIGFLILGVFLTFKVFLPLRAKYLVSEGEKAEAANNSESAQEFFDSAIKINPQLRLPISKFYFDKASRSTKDLQLAKKYYELALKYNKQDVDIYNNLAFVCQLINEFECVTTNYEKALKLKPDNWSGHYGLGTYYDDQGKDDLAEHQYQLAIKINSQAIPAINNLSRLKNLKGDYNAAIALALQALQKTKDPKLKAALYKNLAWAKLEQRKLSQAKDYLEKAEKLDPQRADIYCLLAQVQEALDDNENSWLSWEACLVLESKQPEVFGWRGKLVERIRLKSLPLNQSETNPQ
uniref:non-specific serine/threonine protein kinase n=2 Tax=Desmonostoc muscorum TaxID=1179 RepID=A0A8J6ZJB8_DESMC